MGLIQLDHGSPALPPAGTRPDAIAPATAPMQYGTSTDDVANAAPKLRWLDVRVTSLRKAKLEPRSTMPSAASESGTNSVSVIDCERLGNPVHSTTRQKISQTWLASHTGPIECAIDGRGRRPRSGTTGDEVPEAGTEVGAAEHRVGDDADHQDRPRRRRSAHDRLRRSAARCSRPAARGSAAAVRAPRLSRQSGLAHATAGSSPQDQDERDADADVEHEDRRGT